MKKNWKLNIDDEYNYYYENLEDCIEKVLEILWNFGSEKEIVLGDFPVMIVPFSPDKLFYKQYVIKLDLPEMLIVISKKSAGNINQVEFLSTIRRVYERYLLRIANNH